jgi:Cu2+-exporting ATPase
VAAAEEFSASRLNELITETSSEEDYGRGIWHQIAKYYVMGVLTLAAVGFVSWIGVGLRAAVEVSVAILVVTCPCALGLGLPLGRELMHARLRSVGVLLRRDSFLDRALRVRKIIFDKTGTLTRGQLALDPESRRALLRLDEESRGVLANMTVRSSHPISRTLSAALSISPDGSAALRSLDDADAVREVTGAGLILEHDDATWWLGRSDEGDQRTVFTRDGETLAAFGFEEDLRDDVADEITALRNEGFEIHLLSGDGGERVRRVAETVGISPEFASSSLDPGQKASRIRELDEHDTLMIGDGLNDSPSFDAALCSATPAVDRAVLPQKADFYFLGDGISAVRRSLEGARRLRGVQRDNLVFAVVYNLGAVALCLTGHVDPLVAAILMPLSSVAVVTHTAMRLRRTEIA